MKITKDTNVNLKDTLKQYDNYLSSIVFKINKLSSRYKKHTVRKFRKFDLGNPELIVITPNLSLTGCKICIARCVRFTR